jgi:hypothetical protein
VDAQVRHDVMQRGGWRGRGAAQHSTAAAAMALCS